MNMNFKVKSTGTGVFTEMFGEFKWSISNASWLAYQTHVPTTNQFVG